MGRYERRHCWTSLYMAKRGKGKREGGKGKLKVCTCPQCGKEMCASGEASTDS